MDVREKLVELLNKANSACVGTDCFEGCKFYTENDCLYKLMADVMIENGVTVQEWISVKKRTPTEADGTVLVCLADVFPYNEKETYIDAKHDRRITEAHYSQFSKCWYKDGAVFPDGVVTHWMEKPQPPKGE